MRRRRRLPGKSETKKYTPHAKSEVGEWSAPVPGRSNVVVNAVCEYCAADP
jgi:hypothetical protein